MMDGKKKQAKEEKPRKRRRNDNVADWGGIDENLLRALIGAVTKDGGAVRFGYTRDGGAYSIGIYGDGKPYTEFSPASGDTEAWLEGIVYDFE